MFEAVLGFAFEDDGLGEDAVPDSVFRGGGFAFGRDRAFGFGSVDAGGL
jgi:hypothetical protein